MPLAAFTPVLLYALANASAPNMPLDRAFTLRNQQLFLLEREHARMADSGTALEFIFPRPCVSPVDSSIVCEGNQRLKYASLGGKESIGLNLISGEEYRSADQGVWTTEAGVLASGSQGPVSFALDARLFAAMTDGSSSQSYDREDVDFQDEEVTGSLSYSSFSRYRGNLNLQTSFGRFTVARDAAHWGPGLFTNLVLHQDAVPFNQYAYRTELGVLSVESLYGDLLIGDTQAGSRENLRERNLYAHRYELRLGGNTVLGYSEQLILYGQNKPYLFVPIFPLFIAKGFMYEEGNNGNLAFDVTRRIPGIGLIYTEFLLDDLESPSSLFTQDYVQNKWGWMAGLHLVQRISALDCGFIAEYSRIEPWVYAHFTPSTAQTANLGYPLGNQQGPNSQSVVAKIYARDKRGLYLGLQAEALWKGRASGSSLEDATPRDPTEGKVFLDGASSPNFILEPTAAYAFSYFNIACGARIGPSGGAWARVLAAY